MLSLPDDLDLPQDKHRLLERLSALLSAVPQMVAVVLGGSYAAGTQHSASDLDVSLYYEQAQPFSVQAIRQIAVEIARPGTNPTVTDFYEWGAWVNGGTWIETQAGKLDFLYRNLAQVRKTIREAQAGVCRHDYDQQPANGFYSVGYLAETRICLPLLDPTGRIAALKKQVERYPPRLKQTILQDSLWLAEFTLKHARAFAEQADIYNTAGCLSRASANLTQALFALNEVYFLSDKRVIERLSSFKILPEGYTQTILDVLACPGASRPELVVAVTKLEGAWQGVAALAGDRYQPRFQFLHKKGKSMYPAKLSPGDEIRVIAPSLSLHIISSGIREGALKKLAALGLRVTYARNSEECDEFDSSAVASRLADLQAAFADPQVKGILTAIGGFNCNQLIRHLDYALIKSNPKVLCGYSDITALNTAIYAKTGLVTYSGPHFSTFGMEQGLEYTLEGFKRCCMSAGPIEILPADKWSDDGWYQDQDRRHFIVNQGFLVINAGQASGRLLGGNLCTLNLLQGTEYMPSLAGSILLLEDDDESKPQHFDRDLQSLLHQPDFEGVKGLVIGRFQNGSEMDQAKLIKIFRSKPELAKIPIVANADFGHTTPQFTFPIGGTGALSALNGQVSFTILEH